MKNEGECMVAELGAAGPRIRLDDSRIAWRTIDEEIVAVDIETAEYLSINGSGTVLWAALARGATETELASMLVETYAITPERAREDIETFLGTLRERGLVSVAA